MSKMHADRLKRDFYEARVGWNYCAVIPDVCCLLWCFSFLALPRLAHAFDYRTNTMHDNDNKLSLHATIMHITVLLITTHEMEIARTLWLRAHAKSSKQQRLTELECLDQG